MLVNGGGGEDLHFPRLQTIGPFRGQVGNFIALRFLTVADQSYRSARGFAKDEHITDLLLFPPDTQFSSDSLYHEGKIILQDKASCFPAFILAPQPREGMVVIDATAAPGNKTSHLCALMNNKGKVGGAGPCF